MWQSLCQEGDLISLLHFLVFVTAVDMYCWEHVALDRVCNVLDWFLSGLFSQLFLCPKTYNFPSQWHRKRNYPIPTKRFFPSLEAGMCFVCALFGGVQH